MRLDVRTRQIGELFSEGTPAAAPMSRLQRLELRQSLFAERPGERLRRILRRCSLAVRRFGWSGLACAAAHYAPGSRRGGTCLPDPAPACDHPTDLRGFVANPTPEALLEGFARGLLAEEWFGALAWVSPLTRFVRAPQPAPENDGPAHIAGGDSLSFALDRDFDAVVAQCSKTHASPALLYLHAELHDLGFSHSFELRTPRGRRVACGYGVALGRVFVTTGLSGAADLQTALLHRLDGELARKGFALHDCLAGNATVMGFAEMSRQDYFAALLANSSGAWLGRWQASDLRGDQHGDLRGDLRATHRDAA